MTDVLGLHTQEAVRRLEGEGFVVTCEEVRSRKGSGGTESRVVRQALTAEGCVMLTYALFSDGLSDQD